MSDPNEPNQPPTTNERDKAWSDRGQQEPPDAPDIVASDDKPKPPPKD